MMETSQQQLISALVQRLDKNNGFIESMHTLVESVDNGVSSLVRNNANSLENKKDFSETMKSIEDVMQQFLKSQEVTKALQMQESKTFQEKADVFNDTVKTIQKTVIEFIGQSFVPIIDVINKSNQSNQEIQKSLLMLAKTNKKQNKLLKQLLLDKAGSSKSSQDSDCASPKISPLPVSLPVEAKTLVSNDASVATTTLVDSSMSVPNNASSSTTTSMEAEVPLAAKNFPVTTTAVQAPSSVTENKSVTTTPSEIYKVPEVAPEIAADVNDTAKTLAALAEKSSAASVPDDNSMDLDDNKDQDSKDDKEQEQCQDDIDEANDKTNSGTQPFDYVTDKSPEGQVATIAKKFAQAKGKHTNKESVPKVTKKSKKDKQPKVDQDGENEEDKPAPVDRQTPAKEPRNFSTSTKTANMNLAKQSQEKAKLITEDDKQKCASDYNGSTDQVKSTKKRILSTTKVVGSGLTQKKPKIDKITAIGIVSSSTPKPNATNQTLKSAPNLSKPDQERRKCMLEIIDFLNEHPKFKHLFEFIQEWSLKTSAGTVFIFQGPGRRPPEGKRERTMYRSIGIHLGLLKIIAATLAQNLNNAQFKFNKIGEEVDALLKFLPQNEDNFLAKEHNDCQVYVEEFEEDIRQRFHLPINCRNFSDEILYLRVDTFWNIMIALGGKPMITLDNSQLAAMAQQTKNKVDTHWSFGNMETKQFSLFVPPHINLMEKLKPSYSFIFSRNVAEFRLIKPVADQDSDLASKILVNSNVWRLSDKSGVDANIHWLSDQPVQTWHNLAKIFNFNNIVQDDDQDNEDVQEDSEENVEEDGEEDGEENDEENGEENNEEDDEDGCFEDSEHNVGQACVVGND